MLGNVTIYGSSTAGEFVTEGPLKESAVIFASSCPISYLSVGVGERIDEDLRKAVRDAFGRALHGLLLQFRNLPMSVSELTYSPYIFHDISYWTQRNDDRFPSR